MNIVCAETVLSGKSAFQTLGVCTVWPDRDITREHLLQTDALIVRSKTKVDAALLEGTPVQFASEQLPPEPIIWTPIGLIKNVDWGRECGTRMQCQQCCRIHHRLTPLSLPKKILFTQLQNYRCDWLWKCRSRGHQKSPRPRPKYPSK